MGSIRRLIFAGWQLSCSPAAISRMAITGCPPKVPMLGPRVTRTLVTVGIDSASMGNGGCYGLLSSSLSTGLEKWGIIESDSRNSGTGWIHLRQDKTGLQKSTCLMIMIMMILVVGCCGSEAIFER